MTHSYENADPRESGISNGGILNFECELPDNLDAQEIGFALIELDTEISGMQEPPVARVSSNFTAFNPENESDQIEDYRRFYVEFAAEVSAEDTHAVLTVIMAAMRRLSQKDE